MPDANITKKALATAMKELVSTQGFSKTSIGDICEKCGMNRKSFYYHFRDKYELVNWIFSTEFFQIAGEKSYEDSWAFLLDICMYFNQNRAFYISVLQVSGQDSFREYFAELLRPLMIATMEETLSDERHKEFFASFFTDAFILAIQRWLNEAVMPPEEVIYLLRQGIEGGAMRIVSRLKDE